VTKENNGIVAMHTILIMAIDTELQYRTHK